MTLLLTAGAPLSLAAPDLAGAGWTVSADGRSIDKTFRFDDFPAALAFMLRAGFVAETMNHHPDWTNVYNRVEVRLSTRDAGGVTEKDIVLARAFDTL